MFRIICGEFQPGECLPSIQEMAMKNEISQNVMRRVVIDLIKKGVITRKWHGRDIYITTDIEHLERLKEMEKCKLVAMFFERMHLLGYDEDAIKKEIDVIAVWGKEGYICGG